MSVFSYITSNGELNEIILGFVGSRLTPTERKDRLVRSAWRQKMTITTTLMVLGSDESTLIILKDFVDNHGDILLIAEPRHEHGELGSYALDVWCGSPRTFAEISALTDELANGSGRRHHNKKDKPT
jgi:hypothetical protein